VRRLLEMWGEERLACVCLVHRVDLGNDLEVQLCVPHVHDHVPCVVVNLVQRRPQRLRQRDEGQHDAGHANCRGQNVLPKMPEHVVPAYANGVRILCAM
jgi:hypothetical protein